MSSAATRWKRKQFIGKRWLPCFFCGKRLTRNEATVDHILAKSKGGKSSAKNFAIACVQCNQLKADKPTDLQTHVNAQFRRAAHGVRA